MRLPQQDELLASLGHVAALACVMLCGGEPAGDALGRLSLLAALGGIGVRAVGKASRDLQGQVAGMAHIVSTLVQPYIETHVIERHVRACDPPTPAGLLALAEAAGGDFAHLLAEHQQQMSDELFAQTATPAADLLARLACPAAASWLQAACAAGGMGGLPLPACLAGWLRQADGAEPFRRLDAAPPTELEAVLHLTLSTAGAAGAVDDALDPSTLCQLLEDPTSHGFGAQALQALRQAATISCGGERLHSFLELCQTISLLARAPAARAEERVHLFVQSVNDAFLPALRTVHAALVGGRLLEENAWTSLGAATLDSLDSRTELFVGMLRAGQAIDKHTELLAAMQEAEQELLAAADQVRSIMQRCGGSRATGGRAGAGARENALTSSRAAAMQQLGCAGRAFNTILAAAMGEQSSEVRRSAAHAAGSSGASSSGGGSEGRAPASSAPWGATGLGSRQQYLAELAAARAEVLRIQQDVEQNLQGMAPAFSSDDMAAAMHEAEREVLLRADRVLDIAARFYGGGSSSSSSSGGGAAGAAGERVGSSTGQEAGQRPKLAGKLTGMLLALDSMEVLLLLVCPPILEEKMAQCLQILEQHGMPPLS
ncbi:hypothetical protein ABPG75_009620 [Micractinium tetrahymenae]